MTEPRAGPRGSLAVAILALALAAFASCRAREATRDGFLDDARSWQAAVARLEALPPLPSPLPGLPFWIGAWVGPPVGALDAGTWGTFREGGFDVSMGPLEDRFRREDNTALLDALAAMGSTFTFVRDDSVHPDETTRPGWERRVEAIVDAYRGSPALAGYFLADEPTPADRAGWAPVARLLRQLDPVHPAYVNFVGLSPAAVADPAARARWRADLEAALVEGELPLFTVDAYPFDTAGGESGHFLATLRDAMRVSHATARPFGAVLQFTGHGGLRAVSRSEAMYQAMEALAHGASNVTWFTYWTPNPNTGGWQGGAITYAGVRTDRLPLVAAVNAELRAVATARGPGPMLALHLGADLPAGIAPGSPAMIPHVRGSEGRALSVGFGAEDARGERRYMLVNRDRSNPDACSLQFDESVDSARVLARSSPPAESVLPAAHGPGPAVQVTLEPGGGAVIATWRSPGGRNPRMPSRSGTR